MNLYLLVGWLGTGAFLAGLSSVQSLSHVWLFATPWTAACQASLSITNSWSLLKLMSRESVMPSKHLILYHNPLLLPSIFPSMKVFSNESVLHIRWPKYWSFTFRISPSNEYSGLISFRMDLLGLLAVQRALNLQCSAFFIVQLSHLFILSGVISPLISSGILGTYWPGEFIIHCSVFLPFQTVHEALKARILVPFPVAHVLLEHSTMTRPSWVALQGVAHSFIELDKAVVHVIRLFSFHFVFPVMEKDKRLMEASWWKRQTEGKTGSCSDGWGHAQ